MSEWDENGMQSNSFAAKDEEFVQLEAQAESMTSTEQKSQSQANIQAKEAFKASIEARLNAAQAHKSSIRELQKKVAHNLLVHDKKMIRLNDMIQLKKNKKVRKQQSIVLFPQMDTPSKDVDQQTLLQLESLQTKDDLEKSNQQQPEIKDEIQQSKQGVASIKAPTDPNYLKKVQINNEKPPVKQIKPPVMRSFVQLSTQIKMDLMADQAADIMTQQAQSSSSESNHGQSQFQMEKSKNKNRNEGTNEVSLDSMIMERVEAESTAVARQQMQVQALTSAYEQELLPKASNVVERAVKDVGEGAAKRKKANGYAWAQIDAAQYNSAFEEGIGSDVLVQGQTIREGMDKTGGYVGTDMDENLNQLEDNEQIDISGQIADLHGEQNLIMTKTLLDTRLSLKSLRKHRRQLREKLLCSTNCQFQSWSYLWGIRLGKQCPIDCPIRAHLEGKNQGHTSVEAMDAYLKHPNVQEVSSDKELLVQTDQEIDKLEKLIGVPLPPNNANISTTTDPSMQVILKKKKGSKKTDKKEEGKTKDKKKSEHEDEESDDDSDDDDDDNDSD